jgi:hypothetical protein
MPEVCNFNDEKIEFISECEECDKEAKYIQQENSMSTADQTRSKWIFIFVIIMICAVIAITTIVTYVILKQGTEIIFRSKVVYV